MRLQVWPSLLAKSIEEWKEKPFQWGFADCVHFSALTAAAYLDYDLPALLGQRVFATEVEARKHFFSEFGGKIENIFDRAFKRHDDISFARAGDIVIADNEGQEIAGVIANGARLVAIKAEAGIIFLPVKAVKIAWVTE